MSRITNHIPTLLLLFSLTVYSQPNKVNRYIKKEKFDLAQTYGEEKIARLNNDTNTSRIILKYYLAVARVQIIKNDDVAAYKTLNEALKIVNRRKKSRKWVSIDDYNIMDELSILMLKNGNYIGAKSLINRSLTQRQNRWDKKNPTNFRPYYSLGLYHFRLNNLDSAKYYIRSYQKNIRNSNYTASLEINRYADNFALLSQIELKNNELFKALHYAKKNKRLQNHSWTKKESGRNTRKKAMSRINLARIYTRLGLVSKAKKQNENAHKTLTKRFKSDLQLNYKYYLNKSLIFNIENKTDSLLSNIVRASNFIWKYTSNGLSTLSEYEKENFLEEIRDDIDLIQSVVYSLISNSQIHSSDKRLVNIYELTINTRSLVLDETSKFIQLLNKTKQSHLKDKFSKWRGLKNEISYLTTRGNEKHNKNEIAELQEKLTQLEKELTVITQLNTPPQIVKLTDIQKTLDSSQFAVQIVKSKTFGSQGSVKREKIPFWHLKKTYCAYQRSDSNLYTYIVISKNSTNVHTRITNDSIDKNHLTMYSNSIKYRVTDNKSYIRFAKIFLDSIPNHSSIFLASDGIYNLINLNSLKLGADTFLIDKFNLIMITSLKDVNKKIYLPKYSSVLLLGNPNFSNTKHFEKSIPLPGAEKEVDNIHNMLNKAHIKNKVLLRDKATETAVKNAGQYDILHIATHGFFQSNRFKNPMFNSGLVLATDTSGSIEVDDGVLTAYEFSSISLSNTKLAVLSACETGVGKVKDGEGIYGLQRSLQLTGVNHIIMSLWKVDDEATNYLMSTFYKKLIETNEPKSAFIYAQKEVRKKHSHPYYWASFKLIGK